MHDKLVHTKSRRLSSRKFILIGTYRLVDVTLTQHPLKTVKQDLLIHRVCRRLLWNR
jgi:hypothetical protein